MKEIYIKGGKCALVDDTDFPWIALHCWRLDETSGYAKAHPLGTSGATAPIKLHRLILPPKPGFCVDHINRDKMDNRRSNLRYVNKGENNRNALRRDNRSGFTGVHRTGAKKPSWGARARINGVYRHLGSFPTPQAASAAYLEALRLHVPESYANLLQCG